MNNKTKKTKTIAKTWKAVNSPKTKGISTQPYVQPDLGQSSSSVPATILRGIVIILVYLGLFISFMALLKYGLEYAFSWTIDSERWWKITWIVTGLGVLYALLTGDNK